MKRRILACLLAMSLALTLLPVPAMAVEGAVAEVNGTQYEEEQFQDAIAAAKDGGTVKLLQDYTLEMGSSRLDLTGFKGTFDLGTHTLTLNTTHQMAVYASGAELTVKNGTLAGSSKSYLLYATNGGSLDMEDVTVSYTASGDQPMTVYAGASSSAFKNVTINAKKAGGVEVGNGTGTFEDCTFTTTEPGTGHPFTAVAVSHGAKATVKSGTYEALYGLYVYSTGGTIDVQGGSVTGTAAAMSADAQAGCTSVITASGGAFNGEIQKGSGDVSITLTGGSYTADPSAYLADGYKIESTAGSYQVSVDTSKIIEVLPAGQTSGTKYASLAEALSAAENSTLKLLADVPVDSEITISKDCTVELNGHGLTGSGTLILPSGTYLTINGTGTVACNITNQGSSKNALRLEGGSYAGTVSGSATADGPGAKFSASTYSADNLPLTITGYAPVEKDGWYEFEAITYTINLIVNDGTLGEGFSTPITYPYTGSRVTLPKVSGGTVEITCPGWTFGGWYYSDDNYASSSNRAATADRGYINASTIASKADAQTHVLDLYAKWTKVKEAAVLDASGSQLAAYGTLQEALDAAGAGQTVKLLTDVTLADDTPAKLVDKGTAESPVTLDLNGKTISGSNSKSASSAKTVGDSGILTVCGSYVTLTGSSSGGQGGIINTSTVRSASSIVTVLPSASNGSRLAAGGGVRLENKSSSSFSSGITVYADSKADKKAEAVVNDAYIKSYAYGVDAEKNSNCSAVINGGTIETVGASGAPVTLNADIKVNGGTFTGGTLYTNLDCIQAGKLALLEKNEAGTFVVTVVDESGADYAARLSGTSLCVKSGDLYILQEIGKLEGQTVEVVKSASLTCPEGAYFGTPSGMAKTLVLTLSEGVTLSGSVPMALADITVTGSGTVAANVFRPVGDAYKMVSDGENGLYSCRYINPVAQITYASGKTATYGDIAAALKAINASGVAEFKLLQDITTDTMVNVINTSPEVVIDLNGHTYTYTGSNGAFTVSNNKKLTIKNGTLACAESSRGQAVQVGKTGSYPVGGLVVAGDAVVTGVISIFRGTLDVYGTVNTTQFAEMTPVIGNGTANGGTTVNIHEGAVITAAGTAAAIFHPQSGELNISGGTITGGVGVYMKAGSLNISGGTITANGGKAEYQYNGSGYEPTGDAVVLDACGYPGGAPSAQITGGTFRSEHNQPVACYYYAGANGSNPDIADKKFISGGTYSTEPDAALLAEGYAAKLKQDDSGNYIVELEAPAHEHAWSTEWTYDEAAHWHVCEADGCDITESSAMDGYAAHTRDGGTVTKNPTAEETGIKEYKCTECGYVMETETLDKLPPDTKTYQIETSVTGGTITPSATVAEGGSLKVEYAPGTGYTAEGVSVKVDGVDVDAPSYYTFEAVTDDHSIVVVYKKSVTPVEPETYIITPSVTNGTIDPGAATTVKEGESLEVSYRPNEGYELESVKVDGDDVDAPSYYTFEAVTDNHTIVVVYREKTEEPVEPETVRVDFRVTPENAAVEVKDKDGKVIEPDQDGRYTLEAGRTYTYTVSASGYKTATGDFTPKDEVTVTLSKQTSGGGSSGGSGGSSSGTTKTETTKNPDGSTTTTVTDTRTGTVTETVKTAEGVTGTTVTDKNGDVTKVSAAVPADVAKDAAKSGGTVTLPVEVPAVKDADDAPAVAITVPKSAGAVKVEIPVEKVTSGTVAVIVKADGTEEIVKTSVATKDGVALTVEGGATVKVIDNSKFFVDVHPVDHWAESSIDFVASREIFTGTTANTFTPEAPTTRGQLMTVLARLDGEEASGSGAIQKGMAWAVEKGVSDGSNPGGTITRQQLAAMLYRYAGSPATDFELTHPDAHKVSDYAVDAMRWAVGSGIITGKADGTLDPHGLATRAQVATMMARFCGKMA